MTKRKRPVLELGDILGASAQLLKAGVAQTLPVAVLQAGRAQPRREFNKQRLEDLAQSIREQGVIQPILVRSVGSAYEIVAGERRWRAAQLAGLAEVPVMVREYSDSQARQVALIENLQREDLNLLDEVDAKLDLVAETLQLSREEVKGKLMKLLREVPGEEQAHLEAAFNALGETWQTFARGKLRVLGWPAPLLEALRSGLPFTLGSVIAGAPSEHQAALIKEALGGASRSELQRQVKLLAHTAQAVADAPAQVAKLLGSQRFMATLSASDQKAVKQWLEKMPASLKAALKT